MYFNILKKDLKRKKTMNIILLLFTILAAMFVSSGINNVATVMNGTEYYLDKAGIGDFVIITQNGDGGVTDILEKSKNVEGYKKEEVYWAERQDLHVNGKEVEVKNSAVVIQTCREKGIHYFHPDNEELTQVKKGEVYVTAGFLEKNNCKVGDSLEVQLHGVDKTYRIAGEMKDALLGSDMMGNTRLIISEKDYEVYQEKEELDAYRGCIFNIQTQNEKALSKELAGARNILFSDGRNLIKLCYVMEMIVAMIVLVLSVVLCIVSFVLLKFVITFTIKEEFREIGVMKAIGIKNRKIRSLYLTKYFVLSVVGGVIGFFAGIPFGNKLVESVSKKMYLGQDYGFLFSALGAVLVMFIMILFSYCCTAKIKKCTPLDAIRDGQTGERYGKRSKYSRTKSHFGNACYLAVNDVLSAPRRFLTIILSFFLCSVFVFGVVLVTDTMKSGSMIGMFGKKSDLYIQDAQFMNMDSMSKAGDEMLDARISDMEEELKELGMPGKVSIEVWYKYPVSFDGDTTTVTFQQNKETETTDYEYLEGTAPQNANEIAITKQIAEKIGAEIGDTVTVDFGSEKKDCIVTAYFQTMNQLGSVIRLHKDAPTSMEHSTAMMAFQINFKDAVSSKELEERKETLKDFYGIEEVYNAAEFCDNCMGVADTMDAVAKLLLVITIVVVVLVTVLMERSFISDETSQIALLKAIGFRDGFVIRWQVARFMIVSVLSELLAIALTYPVTKLWCDPIWKTMGAVHVSYCFKQLSLLVIYPGMILGVNLAAVFFAALYTKKIKNNDIRTIE